MDLILFGVCVFLGFKSIRFWGYTYIIMSYVVFSYVGKRKMDKGTNLMLLMVGVLLIMISVFQKSVIWEQLNERKLSDNLLENVRKVKAKRLFNMYDYGGELVYAGIPVFIDGRADLYSKYNYKDYLMISQLQGDFVSLIQKYDFDYFLVDKIYPISTYLKYSPDYEMIYQEDDQLLYKKKN